MGAVAGRQSSDAWGSHLQTTDSATQPWPPKDRGYAGAWGYDRDLSGLYHVGVRAYDPALGRFLQRDPAGAGHPYAYCGNKPSMAVDPSGMALDIHPFNRPMQFSGLTRRNERGTLDYFHVYSDYHLKQYRKCINALVGEAKGEVRHRPGSGPLRRGGRMGHRGVART